MWPLVFAREEEVRAAVLDAWWTMYLGGGLDGRGSSPKEQVRPALGAGRWFCWLCWLRPAWAGSAWGAV
jgi:hypothetical protein